MTNNVISGRSVAESKREREGTTKQMCIRDRNGVFAVHRRHNRHAKIDEAALVPDAETAVLRDAALGDIEFLSLIHI